MKKRIKKGLDHILIYIMSSFIIFGLIIIICDFLWYGFDYTQLLKLGLAVNLFVSIVFINKKSFFISLGLILLCVITLYILGPMYHYIPDFTIFFKESLLTYQQALTRGELLNIEAQYIPTILILFVLSLYMRKYTYRKTNFKRVLVIGLIIFSVSIFTNQFDDKISFIIFLTSLVFYYFYDFYIRRVENKEENRFYSFSSNFVIAAVFFIGISLALNTTYPEPLKWIDDIKEFIEDIGKGKGTGTETGYTFTGADELIESLDLSEDILFEVRAPRTIYLRGEVCDTFDGKKWTKTIAGQDPAILNAEMNIAGLYALQHGLPIEEEIENKVKNQFFYDDFVTVTYKNINTRTVFTTLNTYELDGSTKIENKDVTINYGEIYGADKSLTEGTTYSYKFLNPKYGSGLLKEQLVLDASKVYDEYGSGMHIAYRNSQQVDEKYLQIHETMTDRTKQFAEELTKDYETDYEKAKAIEQYLRKNYRYSYETALPTDDSDTLDYFLFQTQKGFCTYYATSMTMMLRHLGIPARYVKGFIAWKEDLNVSEDFIVEIRKSEVSYVKGKDAHAWVEVYFDGIGWISFEPTPGFSMANTIEYEEYEDVPEVLPEDEEKERDRERFFDPGMLNGDTLVFSGVILLAGIIILLIFIKLISHIIKVYKYKKSKNKNKVNKLSYNTLELLEFIGFKKPDNMTLREYAEDMDQKLIIHSADLNDVVRVYELAYYTDKPISNEQVKLCEGYYLELKERGKEYMNRFKYRMHLLRKF